MSRVATLCGMFGILFVCLGAQCFPTPPPPAVACTAATAATDCEDDDPCTTDTCVIAEGETEGECANTDIECPEGQECDGGTCKTPCDTADECDDANACTDDACGADGFCAASTDNTAACDDDDACTEDDACAAGACAGTALVCDDGLFCNGAETCDVATGCVDGTAPCDAVTETCNEDTDACVAVCDDAGDCDDLLACTVDACVNNGCENTAVDCNDDVACTDDSCDAATGDCVNADNCTAPDTCNLTSGLCEAPVACATDADCAETPVELFCNGVATCDTTTGDCVAGTRPCADDNGLGCPPAGTGTETCAEGDTAAVCTACPPITLDFTLSQDNITGTTGDDIFNGPLLFNASSGTQIPSFQTGDSANGLAGTDRVDASFNFAAAQTVVPTSLSGIETINLTNFGSAAVTLSGTNISGATAFNTVSSVNDVAITGIQAKANMGFKSINDTTVDQAMTFAVASATSATNDEITISLEAATVGTATVTTAATNGFETVNIATNGTTANRLVTLTQTTGTSMTTAKFLGTANLTVDALPTTIRTYDASGITGTNTLTLGSGSRADGTSTYATFAAVDILRVTGGSGNDTFIFGTSLDSSDADQSGESINGGTGDDVLQATFSSALGSPLPLSAIEELRVNATANASSFSLLNVSGVNKVTVESDDTANTLTVDNAVVTSTTQTWPELAFRGDGTAAAQVYDTITYNAFGASASTGDKLTVSFANRATALNATGTTNAHSTASLTVGGSASNGIETLTINASDGPLSVTGATNVWNLNTLTVTGSSNVTLTTITSNADNITSVTASGVTGHFTATIDAMNGGTILLGSGNDTVDITGSAAAATTMQGGAGNDILTGAGGVDNMQGGAGSDTLTGAAGVDTLNGGDDNDIIQGDAGADTITTGNGADTVVLTTVAAASANADVVSDFTAGSGGDQFEMDISALETSGAVDADEAINFVELQDGSAVVDTDTILTQEIAIAAGATAVSANVNVIVIIGTVATTGALETLFEAGGGAPLTIAAAGGNITSAFPVMYSDGTNAFLAICFAETESVDDTDFEATDLTCVNIAQQSGNAAITAGEFVAANFDFVP